MKKSLCAAMIAVTVVLTGCIVTSVCPFYAPKDIAFDSSLLGGWTNVEIVGGTWGFESGGTNFYQLTTTSQSETNMMQAHRFKMGGEVFLDLCTSEGMNEAEPPPIPSHLLLWLSRTNEALQLAMLNYDWLERELTNNPGALRHYFVESENKDQGSRLILTADTPELQKFVLTHLKTEEAWKERINLKRDGSVGK